MLPNRCALMKGGRQCPNPPQYVVSVASGSDEYMVGVACAVHRDAVSNRILRLQEDGSIPKGSIRLESLRPVGTDCVRADPDDLVIPAAYVGRIRPEANQNKKE